MKYLDLIKPHAYLIWKNKQKAIVSDIPLPTEERVLIIQEGQEAFGEIVLTKPSKINLTEFERLEEEHATRPEERKLRWPEANFFYLYRFKEWQPYLESQDVKIENGDAEVLPPVELTEQEQKVLEKAERLPKTLILKDEAVSLEDGKVTFCEGLDGSKIMPILSATFDDKSIDESLSLYQLALVRIPRLKLKKNMEVDMEEDEKAEATKPYKVGKHDGCNGQAVIKISNGKLMGCHENTDDAMAQIDALYAKDKGVPSAGGKPKKPKRKELEKLLTKAIEELQEEEEIPQEDEKALAVFSDEKEISIDQELNVIRDAYYQKFGESESVGKQAKVYSWIKEIYSDYVIVQYGEKLFKLAYAKDVDGKIEFPDKSKWVEVQMTYSPVGNIEAKAIAVFSEDDKEQSLDKKIQSIRVSFRDTFIPKPPKSQEEMMYKSHPWINEIYPDYVVVRHDEKLYKVNYSYDENGQPKFVDKSKWSEMEVQLVPTGNVGAKSILEGYDESSKEFGEWVADYYEFSSKSIADLNQEEAIKAVWSSSYVSSLPNSSFLYVEPDCDKAGCRHLPYKDANGKVDLSHLRNAASRLGQAATGTSGWMTEELRKKLQSKVSRLLEEDGEKAGRKVKKSMIEKLKSAWVTIKEMIDWADPEEEEPMKFFGGKSAIGIKKVGDEYWYVTWSTNAFKDREKEIFSTKSLEKYVTEAEKKEDRGYFNLWHIPDTDFAKKEWQGVAGRFLIEAGPFLKDEKGKAALKFFKEYADGHKDLAPEGWGCSPEYRYLPEERKKGIYENIWITRTSTLPKMAAANIWTQGGVTMALTKEQQKAAELIFGEDLTKQIIKTAEDKTKELEEAGVAHKDNSETKTEEEVKQPEEVIVEKVMEKFDFKTLAEALTNMATQQKEIADNQKNLETKLVELETEVKGAKSEETKKAKDESPKYVWSLVERASEAQKTVVADDDPLKNMKPVETKSDKSGAAHFFGK